MGKKHIIFVGSHREALLPDSTDAVAKSTNNLISALSKNQEFVVEVISLKPEEAVPTDHSVRYTYIGLRRCPNLIRSVLFYLIACLIIGKRGATLAHFNLGIAGLFVWLLPNTIKIRCFHNKPYNFDNTSRRSVLYNLYLILIGFGDRHFDAYLSVSNSVKRKVDRTYGNKPSYLLYNPIDTEKYVPAARKRTQQVTFLYSGRLVPEKGIEELIKAFSQIPSDKVRLRLAGPYMLYTWLTFKENLLKLIRQDERITYLGTLAEAELIKEYQQADVFCFPVKWEEAFGLALCEAYFCGNHLLTTLRGAIPELIGDSEDVTFVEPTVASIRAGLLSTMKSRRYQGHTSSHAARLREKLGIPAISKEYVKILDTLTSPE